MKKFFVILMMLTLSVSAFAGGNETKGGDLFPWPWGTECPFPWKEIEGTYTVHSVVKGLPFNGHIVTFRTQKSDEDVRYLTVTQSDRRGYIYATGKAYSQKDQRIVKGVLKTEADGSEYVVMVRSYTTKKEASCRNSDTVTAITFCPLRGRKCMTDSNYVLEKVN
jgi:hypothetical protein